MTAPSVLPDGTWIDNFRVLRRLGRGGFGVTYLAEEFREWEVGTQTGAPLRLVAIKEFFPRGLATRPDGNTVSLAPEVEGGEQAFQAALKGFYNEAESLMRFDHPNVIKIHRVFQRNGTAYYVMPFLKGESLKSILKREGTLGEERTRRLLLPVLDGLIHAHARGILHRDLKPDNVMIPDEGGPVLIDFGAARAQTVDDVLDYTRHSELVAYTPGYAALEQYGRATRDNPHGPQTDVYGLAAVMYRCVVGEAPPEASIRSMRISSGREDPLVPASARLADDPGYSRSLLAAIDCGLELGIRNRPATLADFRRALDGKLPLPEHLQTRLGQHGVPVESSTRPGLTTTRNPAVPIPERDTQPLLTRATLVVTPPAPKPDVSTELESDPDADTASLPSVQTINAPVSALRPRVAPQLALPPAAANPAVALPPAAADGPRARRGRGVLVTFALLALLPGLAYVGRNHLPATWIETLPPDLLALLERSAPALPEETTVAAPSPDPAQIAPEKAEDPAALAEREAFAAAKLSDTVEAWSAFKRAFPDSPLVATAEIRLVALSPKPLPAPVPVPAPAPPTAAAPKPAPVVKAPVVAAAAAAPVPAAPAERKLSPGGFRDCPRCPEMVRVGGGTFQMGDVSGGGEADELPVRSLTLPAFAAGRYEVTFDEWDACVAASGCSGRPSDGGWGRGRHPVINVSWNDARRYAAWLARETGKNYRLPTEAEFEYLHRAGARTAYPWGGDGTAACVYANVADRQAKRRKPEWSTFPCDDGSPVTSEVGRYQANALGLFDVAGNVWEWTLDCYGPYRDLHGNGVLNDAANCSRRVVRGGAWSDATRNLRSSDRTASSPTATLNIVGFRVVRD